MIKDGDQVVDDGKYIDGSMKIEGNLMMTFTCGQCEKRDTKTFSKHSYERGVVLIKCGGCKAHHLIADNLGWFDDEAVNIETIMAEKGETVTHMVGEDGTLEVQESVEGCGEVGEEAARVALPLK